MTDNCTIGPISIANGYISEEDNKGNGDGTEQFSIYCTHQQALQIRGLLTPMTKTQFGNRYYINFEDPNWGLLPIDASVNLAVNDYINYRGIGYIITDISFEPVSPKYVKVKLTVEQILGSLDDYLRLDYTTGINDGTEQYSDFSAVSTTYKLQEDFAAIADWNAEVKGTGYVGAITAAGGVLSVTGKSGTLGAYQGEFISYPTTFASPFTMEVPLTWVAAGAATNHGWGINLLPTAPVTHANFEAYNLIRVLLWVTPSGTSYYVQKRVNGAMSILATGTLTTAQKSPNFQVSLTDANLLTVKIDKAGGTTWTTIVSSVDISDVGSGPYTLAYGFNNNSNVDKTCTSASNDIYNNDSVTPINVVTLPYGTAMTSATFTRASEDGTLNCYANPTSSLIYKTSVADFYKGTVKAYSTNFGDAAARLITDKSAVLSATKFYVSNGIIKLTTTATGVTLSYWNGASYTDLNTFVTGAVTRIKVTECSPMRFSFMLNRTEWTLEMGKPYCRVSHPYTALTYTIKTCYGHDATTTTDPAAGADITMLTVPYATVWSKGAGTCAAPNPADNKRLLIMKSIMSTIKSDSLPAADLTAIGIVDATETSASYRDAISICKEFGYNTRQAIVTE